MSGKKFPVTDADDKGACIAGCNNPLFFCRYHQQRKRALQLRHNFLHGGKQVAGIFFFDEVGNNFAVSF